jgi:hypothetical protein
MWKLLNKIFGWQYAIITYAYNGEIVRVHTSPTGIQYYKIYGGVHILEEFAVILTLSKQEGV